MSRTAQMKSTLDVISSVALIVAATAFIWTAFFREPSSRSASRAVQVESIEGVGLDAARITNSLGAGSIAIVEFSDFQCPFCAKHANDVLPVLKKELIVKGDVRYIAMHFPIEELHAMALKASEAAECASKQGRFWEMHERLFADSATLSTDDFAHHAESIGLDGDAFSECLQHGQTLDKIRDDQAEGRRLGVTGTPAFFLGVFRADGGIDLLKRIRGSVPSEVFTMHVATLGS